MKLRLGSLGRVGGFWTPGRSAIAPTQQLPTLFPTTLRASRSKTDLHPPNYHHIPHLQLAYRLYRPPEPPNPTTTHTIQPPPFIILHGLLGSARNWHTLSTQLSQQLARDVYAVDLRNHGRSPHSSEHSIEVMASDLLHLLDSLSIQNAVILGHSMGSKVAMYFALKNPRKTSGLIVVDGSPLRAEPKDEVDRIERYIDGLEAVVNSTCKSRDEAKLLLENFVENPQVKDFLMTNLAHHRGHPHHYFTARPNLPILRDYLKNHLFRFPVPPNTAKYSSPTLFVVGSESHFVDSESYGDIQRGWFPRMSVTMIEGAGHWVQADRPKEFLEGVVEWTKKVRL